jgi:hypothetical protein
MSIREQKEIYNPESVLEYGMFTNIKFIRKEKIKNREHVILQDKFGNIKKVYIELYEKYARIMEE